MHFVFHTQYYPPEIGAPQTRLHDLAVRLVDNGMRVTVLTAMPSYPQGRVYAGYGGWFRREQMDGIQVIRTGILPTKSLRLVPRLLSYFSFVFTSALLGAATVGRADYLLTESPPLFLGIAGWFLSLVTGARWIFNVSDLWPESAAELGVIRKGSPSYKISRALERWFYRGAWLVSCQSRTILEDIRQRFPGVRTYYLPNGVDTDFFQALGNHHASGNFHVAYAGLHGLAQGLQQIVLAAHKIALAQGVRFSLIGEGPEKQELIRLAEARGLQNVRFLPAVSQSKIPALLGDSDALVVPLKVRLTGAVPSKLYEAMSLGKPVILIAHGEAAQIVRTADCGLVVQPGDIDGLVRSILYLKDHPAERAEMGQRGRLVAIRDHNRREIADRFAVFLRDEQDTVRVTGSARPVPDD